MTGTVAARPAVVGMDRTTGRGTGDIFAHLQQSVLDILTTPVGSRVLARDYGSRLPELLGAPLNPATIVDAVAATAEALARHEPRLVLGRVNVSEAEAGGRLVLGLMVRLRPDVAQALEPVAGNGTAGSGAVRSWTWLEVRL